MSNSNSKDYDEDDRYYLDQVAKAADATTPARSSIDLDELVAGMAELAEQYPDWREHVPHDVALRFGEIKAYQEQYSEHVDACGLCQGLIQSFDPPVNLLDELLNEVKSATPDTAPAETVDDPDKKVTVAIEALVRKLLGPGQPFDHLPGLAGFATGYFTVLQPELLELLNSAEHAENPLDRFGIANLYLKYRRPELAYRAIGQGLEMCGLEHSLAVRICDAPSISDPSTEYLIGISNEFISMRPDQVDPLHAVEICAKYGDHFAAIKQIDRIVTDEGLKLDVDAVPDMLERSLLQASEYKLRA